MKSSKPKNLSSKSGYSAIRKEMPPPTKVIASKKDKQRKKRNNWKKDL